MDLSAYIRQLGVEGASALFDEKPRTVRAWLYRERFPNKRAAAKIVERSRGKVPYEGIYRPQ